MKSECITDSVTYTPSTTRVNIPCSTVQVVLRTQMKNEKKFFAIKIELIIIIFPQFISLLYLSILLKILFHHFILLYPTTPEVWQNPWYVLQ